MDTDLPESENKALNRKVAGTVVLLSVFMGLANIKDDNLVQAMALAKSDSVDTWSEYQATRTKQHIAETARAEVAAIGGAAPNAQAKVALARFDADIAKYKAEAPRLAKKAQGKQDEYDALNVHDDQFDLSDAALSIAVSLCAVAALAETEWLLYAGWVFGAFGLLMGVAGFAQWSLHPDMLASLLS